MASNQAGAEAKPAPAATAEPKRAEPAAAALASIDVSTLASMVEPRPATMVEMAFPRSMGKMDKFSGAEMAQQRRVRDYYKPVREFDSDRTDSNWSDEETQNFRRRRAGKELIDSEQRVEPTPTTAERELPPLVQRVRQLLIERYKKEMADMDDGVLRDGYEGKEESVITRLILVPVPNIPMVGHFRHKVNFSSLDAHLRTHYSALNENYPQVSLDDVMRNVPQRIWRRKRSFITILGAQAGTGKTYFITKVAPCRWALGKVWPKTDLLFTRQLVFSQVLKAENACQFLGLKELVDGEEEEKELEAYVRDNPRHICVILDSFDLTKKGEWSEFVRNVIYGKELRGIRMIIASRPEDHIFDVAMKRRNGRCVELLGFGKEQVREYVNAVLDEEQAAMLLERFANDHHLMGNMLTPFYTVTTCKMLRQRGRLARTIPALMDELFLHRAGRLSGTRYDTWEDMPEAMRGHVLQLADFAFEGLIKEQQVFSDKEVEDFALSKEALALGLLVPIQLNEERLWKFDQRIIQETLAAKAAYFKGPLTTPFKVIQLMETLGPRTVPLRMFYVLLTSYLDHACAEALVNSLLTRKICWRRWPDGKGNALVFPFDTSVHPMSCLEALDEVLEFEPLKDFAEELFKPLILVGSGKLMMENRVRMDRMHIKREHLIALLGAWGERKGKANPHALISTIKRMISPEFGDKVFGILMAALEKYNSEYDCSSFMDLDYKVNWKNQLDDDQRKLAYWCFLEYCHGSGDKCQGLPTISACLMKPPAFLALYGKIPPDVYMAKKVLKYHTEALRRMVMVELRPPSPCTMPVELRDCLNIHYLRLERTKRDFAIALKVLENTPDKLNKITFRDLWMSEAEVERMCAALAACEKLEFVTLSRMHRTTQASALVMINMLPSLKDTLVELNLEHDKFLTDDLAKVLFTAIADCRKLKEIYLNYCPLTWSIIPIISTSLPLWPVIDTIELEGVDLQTITEDVVNQFMKAVDETLSLRSVSLTQLRRLRNQNPHLKRMLVEKNYKDHVTVMMDYHRHRRPRQPKPAAAATEEAAADASAAAVAAATDSTAAEAMDTTNVAAAVAGDASASAGEHMDTAVAADVATVAAGTTSGEQEMEPMAVAAVEPMVTDEGVDIAAAVAAAPDNQ